MRRNQVVFGMQVETNMGCKRTGRIIPPISLDQCTDGTYRGPLNRSESREWVSVKWDDGTQGFSSLTHLQPIS